MLKQLQINTNEHRKLYYIVMPQFKSAVQPSTYTDNYSLKDYYRRYPRMSGAAVAVWVFVMIASFIGLVYLVFGQ